MQTPHSTSSATSIDARSTSSPLARPVEADAASLGKLAPVCAMVFLEFLAMGLPLPVLPARVHGDLGLAAFFVGLVVGAQSIATLATRHFAGTLADERGPRRAALLGLGVSALSGACYAASTLLSGAASSVAVLIFGRVLLGLGESLVITSALAWGVALVGPKRSGRVMAWVGIAMYGALAIGAPIGSAMARSHGFVGVSLASALAPIVGVGPALLGSVVTRSAGPRLPFYKVARLIWLPGFGLSTCAVGFAAIAAFSTLYFAERGWANASFALTAFGAAFIGARLLFGGLPDKLGGARVAAASVAIAAIGQALLWRAPSGAWAVAASALTGFGFSLAFPSFGVEAIRDVPAQNRGVALGAYVACFDVAMGLFVPALGVLVGSLGYGSAYAAGMVASVTSLGVAALLLRGRKDEAVVD